MMRDPLWELQEMLRDWRSDNLAPVFPTERPAARAALRLLEGMRDGSAFVVVPPQFGGYPALGDTEGDGHGEAGSGESGGEGV